MLTEDTSRALERAGTLHWVEAAGACGETTGDCMSGDFSMGNNVFADRLLGELRTE